MYNVYSGLHGWVTLLRRVKYCTCETTGKSDVNGDT